MSEQVPGGFSAWDFDGTIRPGALIGDLIEYGIGENFLNPADFTNPVTSTMEDVYAFRAGVAGLSQKRFSTLTDHITENIRATIYPWAEEELQRQVADNAHIAVFSLSPRFVVQAAARGIGARRGMGSHFHTQNSTFTGRAVTLNKTQALQRYRRTHGLGAVDFAAGDSLSDLPLLLPAKRAVVVNPNEDLAAHAQTHGWKIVRT